MVTPDIETSTREERLEFIREEFKCLGNCPICGKCSFLRGREAEDLYADYIEGHRSFRDITAEHRNSGHPFRTLGLITNNISTFATNDMPNHRNCLPLRQLRSNMEDGSEE